MRPSVRRPRDSHQCLPCRSFGKTSWYQDRWHIFNLGKGTYRREFCWAPGWDSRPPVSDLAAPNSEEEPGFSVSGRAGPCRRRPHLPVGFLTTPFDSYRAAPGVPFSSVRKCGLRCVPRGQVCYMLYSRPQPRAWHGVTSRNHQLAWAILTLSLIVVNLLTQFHVS